MSAPYPSWRIEPVGDRCLMVAFPDRVEADINQAVHALAARLIARLPEGVTDVVPAFSTLAVHYRPDVRAGSQPMHERLQTLLEALLAEANSSDTFSACYAVAAPPLCWSAPSVPTYAPAKTAMCKTAIAISMGCVC